jgi:4-amino-4-deoxy-L-arabinose transferase-like glycosyltransferase
MVKETKVVIALVVVALILRIAYLFFFVDLLRDNYWEYGEIARNLHMGKGYSLFYPNGAGYSFRAAPEASPYPSAYMMPGYVAFLYPFFFLSDIVERNTLLLLLQGVIGAMSVLLMYRFTEQYFGRREAALAAAIMACLPEFVYASGSYTPTVLFHLLLLALLPVLYGLWKDHFIKSEVTAGALCAALVYVRPEMALFVALCLLAMAFDRRRLAALKIGAVIVILVLPWQIRNAVVFHEWIPFTTSAGLNFFRGHNDLQLGTFADDAIIQGIRDLPPGSKFEPEMSRLYFRRAYEYIAADPAQELANAPAKLLQLWFRDANDPRSTSILYLVPWLIILASVVLGISRITSRRRHSILFLYLVCATAVAVVFFVLPRYQTMMKVALLPFASVGVLSVWDSLRRTMGTRPSGPA